MKKAFDPYYKWLAIPSREQPAHDYRLLGICLFESDRNVIAKAANERMARVRSFRRGANADVSKKLLKVLSQARLRLLNPTRKAVYDIVLRRKLGEESKRSESINTARESHRQNATVLPFDRDDTNRRDNKDWLRWQTVDHTEIRFPGIDIGGGVSSPGRAAGHVHRRHGHRRRTRGPVGQLLQIVLGGVVGLAFGYSLLCNLSPDQDFLQIFSQHSATKQRRHVKSHNKTDGPSKPTLATTPTGAKPDGPTLRKAARRGSSYKAVQTRRPSNK